MTAVAPQKFPTFFLVEIYKQTQFTIITMMSVRFYSATPQNKNLQAHQMYGERLRQNLGLIWTIFNHVFAGQACPGMLRYVRLESAAECRAQQTAAMRTNTVSAKC